MSALALEVAGDGPPVLMAHGLGGSSNTFQPLMGMLGAYAVLRPDLPGSARSPAPAGQLSVAAMAQALLGMLDARGIGRAHLVGHSLGTMVCQHLAATAPGRVGAMVLFGALTEPAEAAGEGLRARAASVRAGRLAEVADQIAARTLSPATHRTAPAAIAFVRESVMRQPPEGYARSCEALAEAEAADWARIDAPTLLVTGADDPVAPVGMARILAERVRGARLEVLAGCGHWTPIEAPGPCARLTAEFLGRHTARLEMGGSDG